MMERQPDGWQRVDSHIDQPVKIKLERGQKGNYGWEITVSAETDTDALVAINRTDNNLRNTYLGGGNDHEEQKT